jgi:hypothetical protein
MSDRERDALERAVKNVIGIEPLTVTHPATVQTQSTNGDVAVQIDDGGPMPGASEVPCVYGLPGVVCKVPQGTRARLSFDNGDPRKRTFGEYDAGCPVDEIVIADTPSLPAKPVSREGDSCGSGFFSFVPTPPVGPTPTGGILFYTAQPSAENPNPTPTPFLSFVGPIAITQLTPGPLPLGGNITGGSSVVKIGG